MRERMDVWGRTHLGGWNRHEGPLLLEVYRVRLWHLAVISVRGQGYLPLRERTVYLGLEAAQRWADRVAAEYLHQ